jgi:hypothetical protein
MRRIVLIHRQFSTLGGLLFGYDQGVVSGILTMESFGARFPRVYGDSSFKGWFVSTLLLGMSSTMCNRLHADISGSCVVRVFGKWTHWRSVRPQNVYGACCRCLCHRLGDSVWCRRRSDVVFWYV